jgi:hypothetical protein
MKMLPVRFYYHRAKVFVYLIAFGLMFYAVSQIFFSN